LPAKAEESSSAHLKESHDGSDDDLGDDVAGGNADNDKVEKNYSAHLPVNVRYSSIDLDDHLGYDGDYRDYGPDFDPDVDYPDYDLDYDPCGDYPDYGLDYDPCGDYPDYGLDYDPCGDYPDYEPDCDHDGVYVDFGLDDYPDY